MRGPRSVYSPRPCSCNTDSDVNTKAEKSADTAVPLSNTFETVRNHSQFAFEVLDFETARPICLLRLFLRPATTTVSRAACVC